MKMKKVLALLLASACVFSFAACGSSAPAEEAAPATEEAAPAPEAEAPAPEAEAPAPEAPEAEAPAAEGAVDEAAYIAYLHDFVDQCAACAGHEDEFYACADALDFETFPGDMFFNGMLGANALTYDEFVAAGGVYEIPEEVKAATAD